MLKQQHVPPCHVLWSPYRDALTRYLSKFSAEAVAYFLTPLRLTNDAYFTRLLDMMQHPLGALLLEEMAASGTTLANLLLSPTPNPTTSPTTTTQPPLASQAAEDAQPGGEAAQAATGDAAAASGAAAADAAAADLAADPMDLAVPEAPGSAAAADAASPAAAATATAVSVDLDPMDVTNSAEPADVAGGVVQPSDAAGLLAAGSADPAAAAVSDPADPLDHTRALAPLVQASAPGVQSWRMFLHIFSCWCIQLVQMSTVIPYNTPHLSWKPTPVQTLEFAYLTIYQTCAFW